MFKAIARLLSSRDATAPRFIAPENRHTESVPAFRASLLAEGLTEAEASAVVVNRTLAGIWYLESKGYSFSQICAMDASRILARPTNERDYYDYCEVNRQAINGQRLRATCGLT